MYTLIGLRPAQQIWTTHTHTHTSVAMGSPYQAEKYAAQWSQAMVVVASWCAALAASTGRMIRGQDTRHTQDYDIMQWYGGHSACEPAAAHCCLSVCTTPV